MENIVEEEGGAGKAGSIAVLRKFLPVGYKDGSVRAEYTEFLRWHLLSLLARDVLDAVVQ